MPGLSRITKNGGGKIAGHTYGITGGNNAENMVWGRNAAAETSWDA